MGQQVICIGDLVLDMIVPVGLPVLPAQHQITGRVRLEPGGAGNFMVAARRMGLDVAAVAAVGDDFFGGQIVEMLRQEGIDTRDVSAVPGSTSTVVLALTDLDSGQHVFLGQYGEGPDAPYPDHLDARIGAADAVFVPGYSLTEARIVPLALRALERAVAAGVPIYFDVGPFMVHSPAERTAWVVQHSRVLLLTEDEIPLVSAGRQGDAALDHLLALGPETLVIKQGPAGCTVVTREARVPVPGYPAQVVDTVGAGDCFDGAFIAGRLRGLSLIDAARLANAMGAAAVMKTGAGRNAPTCREVLAVLEQNGEKLDFAC
ncbi:MAG: carbohydrate kinase family protein [Chloroflexi bacterium]|nr:carbohydrate kinase family protein [Chloroflexota bacterium]